jgi:hypothetical protein
VDYKVFGRKWSWHNLQYEKFFWNLHGGVEENYENPYLKVVGLRAGI